MSALDVFGTQQMSYSYTSPTSLATGSGWEQVSLSDLISNPTASIPQIQANFMNNYQAILINSFFTSLSWKVGKRILRKPIARINTGIFGKRGVIGNIGFKL